MAKDYVRVDDEMYLFKGWKECFFGQRTNAEKCRVAWEGTIKEKGK